VSKLSACERERILAKVGGRLGGAHRLLRAPRTTSGAYRKRKGTLTLVAGPPPTGTPSTRRT
jgi:hypothetical protein